MTTNDFWGDKVEYVQKLANEVADLRGVLQDLSQQVRRIERRIDYVLPDKRKANGRGTAVGKRQEKTPTMSETKARHTLDKLQRRMEDGESTDAIRSELRSMRVKQELTPIARELGMTNTALPPKTELVMRIITRLRQSVMLTENIRKMPRVAEEEGHFGS